MKQLKAAVLNNVDRFKGQMVCPLKRDIAEKSVNLCIVLGKI